MTAEPIEANEGDTVVNADGEEWVIDKRMFIVLAEGSTLRKTGKKIVRFGNHRVFRALKLHTYEDPNDRK